MLVDIALEPRSVLAANVAKSKNRKTHDLTNHLHKYDPFSHNHELLLRTAYGYNTLGLPRIGMEHNIDNVDARMLQQFIMDNVTPGKCYIVASGIKNHREYVDLVKERLGDMLPVPEHTFQRTPSQYIGGEYRTWSESPETHINLAFESVPYNHQDTPAFYVMNQLIGNTSSFNASQPGSGLYSRAVANILQKNSFVQSAGGINTHFTDSGLFGLSIEGAGSHSQDLMKIALEELGRLKQSISDEELNRAKNQLKMDLLSCRETQEDRLQEIARNYAIFGDMTFHKYCDQIDAVTSQQINQAAEKVFSGQPTMVVTGDAINLVPNVTDVHRQLN